MTVRYVGPGGNNSNDGLSWANRKLTLNGVEDTPVQAGDTIYVGAGVYREMLTVDVSGSSGSPITYIGDVTGQNTDGVGGVVVITGSNNDQTATRANAFTMTSKSYRTFRSFVLWGTSGVVVNIASTSTDIVLEDCDVRISSSGAIDGINIASSAGCNITVRRCRVEGNGRYGINVTSGSAVADANVLVENCAILAPSYYSVSASAINVARTGGVTIRGCTLLGGIMGVRMEANPAAGQTVTVNNSLIVGALWGFNAPSGGASFLIEDYNTVVQCNTARTNVTAGANSNAHFYLPQPHLLAAGVQLPQPVLGQLSQWSQVKRIAGTSMATDDLFGITRPTTDSKKSWGAIQYQEPIRETTTTYSSSAASLKLDDAGEVQFIVPVTATSTTISVRAYREADYAGTNPTMVIKQPGQSDRTTTDAGSASTWNELTDTFTPAASPPYVVVCLQSLNTATSGNYDTFFDSLAVA